MNALDAGILARAALAGHQPERVAEPVEIFCDAGGRRPRLLVSAYACAPGRGSEHGVGWNWARELAPLADVWVVTRARRREAITAWEREHGPLGVRWIFHECPRWLLALKRRIGVHAYYTWWQRLLLPTALALHARHRFDAVVHLTMNGFREPGWLWRLPTRFAWGPVGGLQDARAPFLALEDPPVRARERLRGWINRATARRGSRPRAARARATLLLAANGEAMDWARRGSAGGRLIGQLLEAGIAATTPRSPEADTNAVLWVGSDEPRKNPRFALLAFAPLRRLRPRATMTLVGLSERRRQELRAWAASRGLALDGVTFHAKVPREALSAFYARAGQFWFTSWRDTSGNVLLEALAHGAPCLAFDHQGAADILALGAGLLVPPGSTRGMLVGWLRHSLRLLDRPELAARLGRDGQAIAARRFSWRAKAELLVRALAEPAVVETAP
jgi:glycosyltransferase involved in cell wall biosynthesis